MEQKAVELSFGFEPSETIFSIVNVYTRGTQFPDLSAESGYRLAKVAGNTLAMVN
jgi:hypothetical protein